MNLTKFAIENKSVTYFSILLLLTIGAASFFKLGQLEDPDFAIKMAAVTCNYPGATPEEVEQEVTEVIEKKLQELSSIYNIVSYSEAGYCRIKIEIKPTIASKDLPQVWDNIRKKVRDIKEKLPPGCHKPVVADDFGFVYGFLLAMSGDGYTPAEMEDYAKFLQKEFSIVKGISRVSLWGVQPKVIYIETSQEQLTKFGITINDISNALKTQNMVLDSGSVEIQDQRIRVAPSGVFLKPEDISHLKISKANSPANKNGSKDEAILEIGDFATVKQGYLEPPPVIGRFNGRPAIMLAMANQSGGNVVKTGQRLNERMRELKGQLPVGIEMDKVSWQSEEVSKAVNSFLVNLLQAIIIVLVVLTLPMGLRMGIIIGSGLLLTILATFLVMAILKIDLQRMSLGALIIALGMMVDNSIVVADGILSRLQQGMDRKKAAIEAATSPSIPLLGATVIAVMAFYPIFASTESAGEYCATLFTVVAISLIISWIISITITPVQCIDMLKVEVTKNSAGETAKEGVVMGLFGKVLALTMRMRFLTVLAVVALLFLSVAGFGNINKLFFPEAARQQFMVDFWAPQGTRIQDVSKKLEEIEDKLNSYEEVDAINTFIGAGPPRFYLPVEPEGLDQAYGHIVINTKNLAAVNKIIADINPWMQKNFPNANCRARPFGVGPSKTWPFELRIIGPKDADTKVLRQEADKVLAILKKSPYAANARTDMREPRKIIVPQYDQSRGRWADIQRHNIAEATKRAFDGVPVGLYREKDSLYPILFRHNKSARNNLEGLNSLQIQPNNGSKTVPLPQVTQKIAFDTEDPLINRMDRRRMISIQAAPNQVTFPTMKAKLAEDIAKIELPEGYQFFWAGEAESTQRSQQSLIPGVIPALIIVIFIIVALFNAFRPAIIILIVVPFAMIGVTTGLLMFNADFGFVALLGAMSLAGMMIKNSIVLLDEAELNLKLGLERYDAIVAAAKSRLRPVVLAAATTVLGVVPLLQDGFWVGLAVAIMVGLTFGTILTMVLVPVLYSIFYRLRRR